MPRVWQTIYPYRRGGGRGTRARHGWRGSCARFERLAPDSARCIRSTRTSPQECSEITAHVFPSLRFDTTHHVPSYRALARRGRHLRPTASTAVSSSISQPRQARQRWVLKCPDHLFALDAIREVYPDARFVFVHRDPMRVLLRSRV